MQRPQHIFHQHQPSWNDPSYYKHAHAVTLNNFTNDQSRQSLIDRPRTSTAKSSKTQAICRAFGLQALYSAFRKCGKRKVKEEEKVAISKDRWLAFFRGLIHLIPIAAAITLIVINCLNYYIGGELAGYVGEDSQKLAALQVTAKLHELFMLASIAVVVFAYVRKELTTLNGVPLGAVFAGLQTANLSFLWSVEMMGIFTTTWSTKRKKAMLIFILLTATFLGLAVGPSTAILMRPRLDAWPAGGTTFWTNGTLDQIRPLVVSDNPSLAACVNDTRDWSCPYGNWVSIWEEQLSAWENWQQRTGQPTMYMLPGDQSSVLFQTTASNANLYSNARTMATGPPFYMTAIHGEMGPRWVSSANWVVSRASYLSKYRYSRFRNFRIINTWQPAVHAICRLDVLENTEPTILKFPDIASYIVDGAGSVTRRPNYTTVTYGNTQTLSDTVALYNKHRHGALWLDDPSLLKSTNSSINAIITVAYLNNVTHLHSCSIDARHIPTVVQTSELNRVVQGVPQIDWLNNGIRNTTCPQITIQAGWARYLNPNRGGASAFNDIFSSSYVYNRPSEFMENMLANLFVNGLARWERSRRTLGTLRSGPGGNLETQNSWRWCFMPKNKHCTASSAYDIDAATAAKGTRFQFDTLLTGYSYSRQGAAAIVAIVVLSIYCAFALAHFIYTVSTGWTSTAWDTPAEIMALAMQSQLTSNLKNTGAGIETLDTFEARVHIKVNGDVLEYVFDDTDAQGNHRRIERNVRYS